jgi:hypothetical protein
MCFSKFSIRRYADRVIIHSMPQISSAEVDDVLSGLFFNVYLDFVHP